MAMQGGTLKDYWSRKLLTMQRVGSEHVSKKDRTSQVWKTGIVSLCDSLHHLNDMGLAGFKLERDSVDYKEVTSAAWDGLRCTQGRSNSHRQSSRPAGGQMEDSRLPHVTLSWSDIVDICSSDCSSLLRWLLPVWAFAPPVLCCLPFPFL